MRAARGTASPLASTARITSTTISSTSVKARGRRAPSRVRDDHVIEALRGGCVRDAIARGRRLARQRRRAVGTRRQPFEPGVAFLEPLANPRDAPAGAGLRAALAR